MNSRKGVTQGKADRRKIRLVQHLCWIIINQYLPYIFVLTFQKYLSKCDSLVELGLYECTPFSTDEAEQTSSQTQEQSKRWIDNSESNRTNFGDFQMATIIYRFVECLSAKTKKVYWRAMMDIETVTRDQDGIQTIHEEDEDDSDGLSLGLDDTKNELYDQFPTPKRINTSIASVENSPDMAQNTKVTNIQADGRIMPLIESLESLAYRERPQLLSSSFQVLSRHCFVSRLMCNFVQLMGVQWPRHLQIRKGWDSLKRNLRFCEKVEVGLGGLDIVMRPTVIKLWKNALGKIKQQAITKLAEEKTKTIKNQLTENRINSINEVELFKQSYVTDQKHLIPQSIQKINQFPLLTQQVKPIFQKVSNNVHYVEANQPLYSKPQLTSQNINQKPQYHPKISSLQSSLPTLPYQALQTVLMNQYVSIDMKIATETPKVVFNPPLSTACQISVEVPVPSSSTMTHCHQSRVSYPLFKRKSANEGMEVTVGAAKGIGIVRKDPNNQQCNLDTVNRRQNNSLDVIQTINIVELSEQNRYSFPKEPFSITTLTNPLMRMQGFKPKSTIEQTDTSMEPKRMQVITQLPLNLPNSNLLNSTDERPSLYQRRLSGIRKLGTRVMNSGLETERNSVGFDSEQHNVRDRIGSDFVPYHIPSTRPSSRNYNVAPTFKTEYDYQSNFKRQFGNNAKQQYEPIVRQGYESIMRQGCETIMREGCEPIVKQQYEPYSYLPGHQVPEHAKLYPFTQRYSLCAPNRSNANYGQNMSHHGSSEANNYSQKGNSHLNRTVDVGCYQSQTRVVTINNTNGQPKRKLSIVSMKTHASKTNKENIVAS